MAHLTAAQQALMALLTPAQQEQVIQLGLKAALAQGLNGIAVLPRKTRGSYKKREGYNMSPAQRRKLAKAMSDRWKVAKKAGINLKTGGPLKKVKKIRDAEKQRGYNQAYYARQRAAAAGTTTPGKRRKYATPEQAAQAKLARDKARYYQQQAAKKAAEKAAGS